MPINASIKEAIETGNFFHIPELLQRPELASELLENAQTLLENAQTQELLKRAGCDITQTSIPFYKTRGRRPSFFGILDTNTNISRMFHPKGTIGRGASSTVRKFEDNEGYVIAVKQPNKPIPAVAKKMPSRCQAMLDRETTINKKVYPNDSDVITFQFPTISTYRSIMPYVPGETAWILLKKSNCPHELAQIIVAMAKELDRMHQIGVIHGDMNPKNCILKKDLTSQNYQARFVDFEHTYLLTDETAKLWDTNALGLWIAPELCNNGMDHVAPCPSQDIYGLGFALQYTLHRLSSYITLLSTYPMIKTFIQDSQKQIPNLRPNLNTFYTQLDREIHLNSDDSGNEYDQENAALSRSFGI